MNTDTKLQAKILAKRIVIPTGKLNQVNSTSKLKKDLIYILKPLESIIGHNWLFWQCISTKEKDRGMIQSMKAKKKLSKELYPPNIFMYMINDKLNSYSDRQLGNNKTTWQSPNCNASSIPCNHRLSLHGKPVVRQKGSHSV